jgi:hypothetical protein
MADLNANIILGGTQPVQPFDPARGLQQVSQLEDLRAQVQQRQATAENLRQQALARIEAAKDQADIQNAVQSTNGDVDAAVDALQKIGKVRAATALQTTVAKSRKESADALDAQTKAQAGKIEFGLHVLNGATDEASEQYAEQSLAHLSPEVAGLIQKLPANLSWEDRKNALQQVGLTAKDAVDNKQKALDAFTAGKFDTAAGHWLGSAVNQQTFDQFYNGGARAMGIPQTVIDELKATVGTTYTPEAAQKAQQMALTPEQQEQAKDRQATLANTQAYQQAELGIRRGELSVQQQREARERAAAAGGANGAPSDAVLGYAADLKAGRMAITAVPAAGHMRDQVEAYMRQQGFDMKLPLTAQVRARYEFASSVLPQVAQVEDLARQVQAAGLMGTFSGRLRDAATAESAAASMTGLTPAQQRLIGQFATQADLLASGTAMAHFGARGGAQADEMRAQLTAGHKSLDTFLGNLAAVKSVLQGYADDLNPDARSQGDSTAKDQHVPVPGHPGVTASKKNGRWIVD